jgi:hypothetical protein
MKKVFQFAVFTLLIAALAGTAVAQKKSKDETFKEIATLTNTKKPEDSEKAYQLAKEFFAQNPKEKGDVVTKIKDWIKRYRENKFYSAIDAKDFALAFPLGKEILADEPENTSVTMLLAYGGFDALAQKQDKSYGDDALAYGKKSLELMEKGNLPSNFAPFANKEDALAWMYYIIATFTSDKNLKEAAGHYYKATLYESQIKKTSQPYYVIAYYYESLYEKLSEALKAKAKGLSDAEFKAETEKVDKIVDQMMDAYARAYTLGTAEKNPNAAAWKDRLTQVYQYRKKTTAGLDAFITYIVSTPFVDPTGF